MTPITHFARFKTLTGKPFMGRCQRHSGQSLAEYALVLALIAVACIGSLIMLGDSVQGQMEYVAERFSSAVNSVVGDGGGSGSDTSNANAGTPGTGQGPLLPAGDTIAVTNPSTTPADSVMGDQDTASDPQSPALPNSPTADETSGAPPGQPTQPVNEVSTPTPTGGGSGQASTPNQPAPEPTPSQQPAPSQPVASNPPAPSTSQQTSSTTSQDFCESSPSGCGSQNAWGW